METLDNQPTESLHLVSSVRLINLQPPRRRPREAAMSVALQRWFCQRAEDDLQRVLRFSREGRSAS